MLKKKLSKKPTINLHILKINSRFVKINNSSKNFDKMDYMKFPCFMNTASRYRSIVMQLKNIIFKNDPTLTNSEAMKQAWRVAKFLVKMYAEPQMMQFAYVKITGEIREATGTRNDRIIPPNRHNPQNPNTINLQLIPYFDSEKNGWRNFKPHSLIES